MGDVRGGSTTRGEGVAGTATGEGGQTTMRRMQVSGWNGGRMAMQWSRWTGAGGWEEKEKNLAGSFVRPSDNGAGVVVGSSRRRVAARACQGERQRGSRNGDGDGWWRRWGDGEEKKMELMRGGVGDWRRWRQLTSERWGSVAFAGGGGHPT
jgi:hypothetical protein